MRTADLDLRTAYGRGAALADLVRLHVARLPLGAFLLAGVAGGASARHLAGGVLLILGSYGFAAAYNDLRDVEIDQANGRSRPLATGVLATGDARAAMAVCAAVTVLSQLWLVQPRGLIVTLVAAGISVAYSHDGIALQRRGIWGTAALALNYLVLPVALAGVGLRPGVVVALMAGGVGTLLYKDVKDEAGDRLLGKRTPLVRWGLPRMEAVAAILGGLSLVIGSRAVGAGWWTAAQVGGLVSQAAMVATGRRLGRLLAIHRLLACGGLVGLGAQ